MDGVFGLDESSDPARQLGNPVELERRFGRRSRFDHDTQQLAATVDLDIVEFDPPNEFVLEGETRVFRYCDHLEFSTEGEGTRLRYYAELGLKGPLSIVEALLQRTFTRIGDDATQGLPDAAVAGV